MGEGQGEGEKLKNNPYLSPSPQSLYALWVLPPRERKYLLSGKTNKLYLQSAGII